MSNEETTGNIYELCSNCQLSFPPEDLILYLDKYYCIKCFPEPICKHGSLEMTPIKLDHADDETAIVIFQDYCEFCGAKVGQEYSYGYKREVK